jgi:hypothetical protein
MEPHAHRVHVTSAVLVAVLLLSAATAAQAQLSVTVGNAGRGFVLTDYAAGFPNGGGPFGLGPIGIAFYPPSTVFVSDLSDLKVYGFADHVDGKSVTAADVLKDYTGGPVPFSFAEVKVGGVWRIFTSTGTDLQEFDPIAGTLTMKVPGGGGLGMAPFPAGVSGPHAGHIFIAGSSSGTPAILEFDPSTTSSSILISHPFVASDGISVSPDGAHLIIVRADSLYSLNITGPPFPEWAGPSHAGSGYDGAAFGLGSLAGYVYVNCNNGDVYEFGVPWGANAGVDNLLLTGGSRGDFIAVDPIVTSGGFPSLLLTQTDRITRLDPPGGGWFGPPASTTQPITNGSTGVIETGPFVTRLLATAPNPTPGSARLDYVLGRESHVRIGVLDLQGREVAVIEDRTLGAGTHQAVWDGRTSQGAAAAGLYFVRMVAGGVTSTRSITLAH